VRWARLRWPGGGARSGEPSDAQKRILDTALAGSAGGAASLSDVERVVILMQENRSFDHYFGTLSAVRGFSDLDVPMQMVGGAEYPVFDQLMTSRTVGPRSFGAGTVGRCTPSSPHSWLPNFTVPGEPAFPTLPVVSIGDASVAEQAVLNALAGTLDVGIPYPLPTSNSMPVQESTPARPEVP
jgi:phospholipase C